MRRIDARSLRAALWAQLALIRTRRSLRRRGLDGANVPPPPHLPPEARRGVLAVLRRQPHTCLERALVLQSWEAAQGRPREVVIGVALAEGDFAAHAWLSDEPVSADFPYHELMRLPAR
jgi:hypothetical protein